MQSVLILREEICAKAQRLNFEHIPQSAARTNDHNEIERSILHSNDMERGF